MNAILTSTSALKTEIRDVGAMTGEDLERLMKADIKMREKIAELEHEIKDIKEKRRKVQDLLIETCRILKVESLKTKIGTLTRSVKERYWTTDWPSMYKFIKDKELLEFMEKRLNQTNVKEYIANNPDDSPPGLQVTAQYTVSIRKNKSYEEVE